jgi:hypothetical protein
MTRSFLERRDRVRAALLTGDARAWLYAPWFEVCGRLLQFRASISAAACSRRAVGSQDGLVRERRQSRAVERDARADT